MITKYFTKVVVRFNPLGKEAKSARLLLCAIPPAQRTSGTSIQNELLVNGSSKSPIVKITFKDKTEMEADPSSMTFKELGNYFDRHSRKLSLKESIESQ
ncbi:LANO_0H17414g1_1 [Lachancea nothofagi CBS 11611]|uniref:Large ribosomal subunit protein mL53 n=1 Tax=Lachancea nothofagi CBS 11611 TaxID=1266666 RepID=A0A1G4KN20_9SACH|nr:LANO_0H17414g1_1 [Lachancea nothofagi CBS 11611]